MRVFTITLLAVALALRYASAAMAVLGLFGGYLTPLLLSNGEDRLWFLFSYILLLDGGALFLARAMTWLSTSTRSLSSGRISSTTLR